MTIVYVEATDTSQGKADRYGYRTGQAAGLQRAEIRLPKAETTRLPFGRDAYPIRIKLMIGQSTYTGTLRYAPSQDAAWISSVLVAGGFRELVLALKAGGFAIGQRVRLRVTRDQIAVLPVHRMVTGSRSA